jgi:hypothetical protein
MLRCFLVHLKKTFKLKKKLEMGQTHAIGPSQRRPDASRTA